MNNQEVGKFGEDIAEEYLKNQGYEILERNFRCRMGEVDIVAKDETTYVFVEVKTRRSDNMGLPREAVDSKKVAHIRKAASVFLVANHLKSVDVRFDVVEVYCNHIRGGF